MANNNNEDLFYVVERRIRMINRIIKINLDAVRQARCSEVRPHLKRIRKMIDGTNDIILNMAMTEKYRRSAADFSFDMMSTKSSYLQLRREYESRC